MNLSTDKSFCNIKGAISAYQAGVTDTLNAFKVAVDAAKAESQRFKDEDKIFAEKKAACVEVARSGIAMARETLKSTMQGEVDSLKSELTTHLTTPVNPSFRDTLILYKTYSLPLSKVEIEGLIKLNMGAPIGYRMLNKVLEDGHSRYRVDVPSVSDYEGDITLLERISTAPLWSTTENYPELVSVFNGTQREDSVTGVFWDRTTLLISRSDFDSKINKLADMESRWSATVTPSLKTIELYEEKDGKTAEQQLADDIRAVPDAATIEHSEGETVQQARLMGAERATADARSAEILSLYTR